jgi:hypothetical protein
MIRTQTRERNYYFARKNCPDALKDETKLQGTTKGLKGLGPGHNPHYISVNLLAKTRPKKSNDRQRVGLSFSTFTLWSL